MPVRILMLPAFDAGERERHRRFRKEAAVFSLWAL